MQDRALALIRSPRSPSPVSLSGSAASVEFPRARSFVRRRILGRPSRSPPLRPDGYAAGSRAVGRCCCTGKQVHDSGMAILPNPCGNATGASVLPRWIRERDEQTRSSIDPWRKGACCAGQDKGGPQESNGSQPP